MSISRADTPLAPRAIGPYSQATIWRDLIFASGQLGLVPETGKLDGNGIVDQAHRVLRNLSAVLEAAGSDLGHVLKTTVYLTDLNDFAAINRVYEHYFGDHRPARATVQVAALPANANLEIDCIAIRPD